MADWDYDKVREALELERHPVHGGGDDGDEITSPTYESIAKQKLVENVPIIVDRLIWIALQSESESLSAKVGMYLTDKVMGRTTDAPISAAMKDDVLRGILEKAYSMVGTEEEQSGDL